MAVLFGAARMIRHLLASAAFVALLSNANAQMRIAADLDVRPYLLDPLRGKHPIGKLPPSAQSPNPTEQPRDQGGAPRSGSIASSKPLQPREALPQQAAAPSVPAPPVQNVAAAKVLNTTQAAAPTERSTFLSSLVGLGAVGLGFFAVLIGLLALPTILWAFDAMLERPLECDVGDARTDSDAHLGGFDVQDFAQSELSAADIHRQTEVLRALKEALDAELDSVRAAIRRERARAEAKAAQ